MDPVFLAIITGGEQDGCKPMAAICRGREQLMTLFQRAGERESAGQVLTTLEVVNSVHDLSSALAKTMARRRGRGSA